MKKGVLRNFANLQEKTRARVSFVIKLQAEACNFIKKETLTRMFYCEKVTSVFLLQVPYIFLNNFQTSFYWLGKFIRNIQKLPSIGVLIKRFSEDMQQFTGEHP